MKNKCPKCGTKLSIFYIKQNCSGCGCDLLNFDRERKLEEDAAKAEAEFEKLEKILGRFKKKNK